MTSPRGYQTTEFWITLMTNIVAIANLFHPIQVENSTVSVVASIIVLLITNITYIFARAKVKTEAP